jgi:formylglycine-generating enzyme required for sulfatase activity
MSPQVHAAGGVRWKVAIESDGQVVIYTGRPAYPAPQEDVTLIFRRVDASTGVASFYLCTTETTVGTFNDVLAAGGHWLELKRQKLLGDFNPRGPDPRPGPRAWQWSTRYDGGITSASAWLSKDWLPDNAGHYPQALAGNAERTAVRPPPGLMIQAFNPSPRQPIQQISAEAAAYFAPFVGCRLPTPDEWKLAYASSGKSIKGANLRDVTWRTEYEHMARTWREPAYRPDAGAFIPEGEARTADVWKSDDGAELDDGVVWFRQPPVAETPEARQFNDLAGNVGEFTRDAAGHFYVIGDSALSPPSRPIDKACPLDARDNLRCFSDVGFRLAFSAAPGAFEQLTAALPDPGWWLLPEHPATKP